MLELCDTMTTQKKCNVTTVCFLSDFFPLPFFLLFWHCHLQTFKSRKKRTIYSYIFDDTWDSSHLGGNDLKNVVSTNKVYRFMLFMFWTVWCFGKWEQTISLILKDSSIVNALIFESVQKVKGWAIIFVFSYFRNFYLFFLCINESFTWQ